MPPISLLIKLTIDLVVPQEAGNPTVTAGSDGHCFNETSSSNANEIPLELERASPLNASVTIDNDQIGDDYDHVTMH